MRHKQGHIRAVRRAIISSAVATGLGMPILLLPQTALGLCVCGYSDGRFTANQPLALDGEMGDWGSVLADTDNNVCDGGVDNAGIIFQPQPDRDAPVQSTGRDLVHFSYTWDGSRVFTYTERAASDNNVENFIYYADTNNNKLMETGERVIVAKWQGNNREVNLYLGSYIAANGGGDPLVNGSGFADGYKLPGRAVNFPPTGQPDYTGSWGSADGLKMEWAIPWGVLGIPPNTAFTFHVSSTNSTPGTGSFPAQVDDNMGGCGGGPVSTQYADLTFVPNRTLQTPPLTTAYAAHVVTNTGNGIDRFELTSTASGGFSPTVQYYRDSDGNGAFSAGDTLLTDTDGDGKPDTGALAAGSAINLLVALTVPDAGGTAAVVTTATSRHDPNIQAAVTDTVALYPKVTVRKLSNGATGSFSFAGTNGLPGSFILDTSAANPQSSAAYAVTALDTATDITETVPAGWTLNDASCTDGAATFGALTGATLTIPAANVTAGKSITCTFTNSPVPTTVRIAETANGSGTFGFTMTNLGNGSDSIAVATPPGTPATVASAQTSTVLALGTDVTIQESSVPGGWPAVPASASCVDTNGAASGNGSGSFGTLSGNTLLVPASYLRPYAQILCTFANSAPGTGLILVKDVDKAAAYPGDTLTYTITYANNSLDQLSNIVISDNVPTFTVSPSACCVNPSAPCLGTPTAPYPSSITGCTTLTTSSSVTWTLSGTLAPGASGQVKLSVVIEQ